MYRVILVSANVIAPGDDMPETVLTIKFDKFSEVYLLIKYFQYLLYDDIIQTDPRRSLDAFEKLIIGPWGPFY